MTGRILFQYLNKINFIFVPISITYKLILNPFLQLIYKGGMVLKYYYMRDMLKKCGTNVTIHRHVTIRCPQKISIGNNVSIHPLCYIDGEGGITIGSNISIAHNSTIMSFNHTWEDKLTPIKYNPKKLDKVTICDDVWIGCGVRIMAGVTIGNRCIIAAGAVVTKDCESNSLYGGVPARKIKNI